MPHTPGPWIIEENNFVKKSQYAGACHRVKGIAEIWAHKAYAPGAKPRLKECLANARLIAAAPEMLDMLKELHLWAAKQSLGGFADKIGVVIAKAEGKE